MTCKCTCVSYLPETLQNFKYIFTRHFWQGQEQCFHRFHSQFTHSYQMENNFEEVIQTCMYI